MQNVIGLVIIVIFSMFIVMIRGKIHNSNNEYLKKAAKIGDWFIWFRVVMTVIVILFFLFIFAKGRG